VRGIDCVGMWESMHRAALRWGGDSDGETDDALGGRQEGGQALTEAQRQRAVAQCIKQALTGALLRVTDSMVREAAGYVRFSHSALRTRPR
jgi:hypothetical protein